MSSLPSSRSTRLRGLLKQSRDGSLMKSRAELKAKLTNRLFSAYSGHCEGEKEISEFKKKVKAQVDRLDRRCSRAKITEKDLRELEDTIRSMGSQGLPSKGAEVEHCGNGSRVSLLGGSSVVPTELPQDNYQVFVEADRVHFEREMKAHSEKLKAKQRETKKILDNQMEELRQRRLKEKQESVEFAEMQREMVKRDEEYLLEKKRLEKERIEKDKLQRFEQIKQAKARKQRREEFQKREAEKELEKCKQALEGERKNALAKQEEQRKYMLKVEKENEVRKKEREERKRQIWEEDIRRAKEYEAKLAADEAARAKALADLQAKSKLNQRRFEIATENAREAERQLEARIAEFHKQKMEKEQKRLEEARAKQKEDLKRMKATLDDQMKQREVAKQKELEELHRYSVRFRREAEQNAASEKVKQLQLRNQARAHQAFLQRQIEEQKRKKAELDSSTLVTKREQQINSKTFQRIHSDTELVRTIKQNLRDDRRSIIAAKKAQKQFKASIRSDYYR